MCSYVSSSSRKVESSIYVQQSANSSQVCVSYDLPLRPSSERSGRPSSIGLYACIGEGFSSVYIRVKQDRGMTVPLSVGLG
jgi:hypothetical protein